jgi:tRNA 2-thiouridine synthesizing protein A
MESEITTLDCSGLQCPMPIVAISRKVNGMQPNSKLRVLATDQAFEADVRAWARMTSNAIVSYQGGDPQEVVIKLA